MEEKKFRDKWDEWGIYKFCWESNKPVYSIDVPPRYADGSLHIGHATHYTKMDFLARYKRMREYRVFFPMCADVNGMPIEISVEKKFGVNRKNTPKDELIDMCTRFATENIKRMIEQYEMLGLSLDKSQFYRTDSKEYRSITQYSFLELLKWGLIYRHKHPVLWCPSCETALASADVEYEDRETTLNWIEFRVAETKEKIEIATTRPELICACQAVGINPHDTEKEWLIGKHVITPIFNKEITVITDEKIDPKFGSGIVMICSIGDKEDLEWIYKHRLNLEQAIDKEGRLTETAGKYSGLSVADGRKAILEDLEKSGLISKVESIKQSIGLCWRCHSPVEFLQIPQWFIKTLDFKNEILNISDGLKWHPPYMKVRLENWVNSLAWDWVISRQRYFATPIPIWECIDCGEIIPAEEEMIYVDPTRDDPPVDKCPKCGGKLKGSEEVFDTWMDSSMTALYNCYWHRDESKFKLLYPMSLRPQSHDIIRNWAMYTILKTFLMTGDKPWEEIMVDGFVLAPDGRPMHSSWGNVVDPAPIVEEYGADSFRFWAAKAPIGKDTAFQFKEVSHGSKLLKKLDNIQRFIQINLESKATRPEEIHPIDAWIISRFNLAIGEITASIEKFDFALALEKAENFVWHEFADHYLELVKPRLRERKDISSKWTLYELGFSIIKLFAPFFCFWTEKVYQDFYRKFEKEKSIHLSSWPAEIEVGSADFEAGELAKDIVSKIRSWKNRNGIPLNSPIEEVVIVSGKHAQKVRKVAKDIADSMSINQIEISEKGDDLREVVGKVKPDYKKIGLEFREKSKKILEEMQKTPPEEIYRDTEERGKWKVRVDNEQVEIGKDKIEFEKDYTLGEKKCDLLRSGKIIIAVVR
jgi:valyl-tRNA synthetase